MNTFYKNETQDPRDQETPQKPSHQEEQQREYNRPDTKPHPEEKDPKLPSLTPETDNGEPSASRTNQLEDQDEELIEVKKDPDFQLKGDEEDEEEMDEEEEDEDEEEDDDMDEDDEEDEMDQEADTETERGRDTNTRAGDEFSSPAKPGDTNFEDPAQNRKTDSMTDHEPRVQGI
ncbi:MAG: hypothetical protein ACKOW2_02790 [Sphingobacteriaceae bacterium]